MEFPCTLGGYTDRNKYLYNNKELQDDSTSVDNNNDGIPDFTLQWYDFGFRNYDPAIGRFIEIDPIAEDFIWVTPYNYAENEPMAHIDLWGLQAVYSASGLYHSPGIKGSSREFIKNNPKTAAAIAAVPIAIASFGIVNPVTAASFVGNEIKDEALSMATGGASDILDATKMGAKLIKEGSSMIFRAVSKAELSDIKDTGLIKPGNGSMETKLFTDNVGDATKQGKETGKDFTIIQVEVPNSTLKQLESLEVDRHMTTGKTIAIQPDKQDLLNTTRGKISTVNN